MVEVVPTASPAPTYSPSAIDLLIQHAAAQYNLDPRLFRAQLIAESSLNPNAQGQGGELGIAQLSPATATALGVTNARDPTQAIPAAARYMRQNLDRFGGDYNKALAAYNWGPGNVAKFGVENAPPPTKAYIARITGAQPGVTGPAPAPTQDTDQMMPPSPAPLSATVAQAPPVAPVPPPGFVNSPIGQLSQAFMRTANQIQGTQNPTFPTGANLFGLA